MRVLAYNASQVHDMTYYGVESMTWSIVEQGVGIVCACLPILRPLLRPLLRPFHEKCYRNKGRQTLQSFGLCDLSSTTLEGSYQGMTARNSRSCQSTIKPTKSCDEKSIAPSVETWRSSWSPIGLAITSEGASKVISVPETALKRGKNDDCNDLA